MSEQKSTNEQRPLVLIVEDDAELAQLNARLLKRNGIDSVIAYNAAEARSLARGNQPDLFVLDVGLPDGDGFSLCLELRRYSDAPVLFLTGRTETSDKVKGLSMSADYYLTKPYDRIEFVAVVKNLLRRAVQAKRILDETSVIVRGSLALRLAENRAYVNGRDVQLTSKEFAILLTLVQNEDVELSGKNIYEKVWNAPFGYDTGTIRVHISNLKKKIDEENAPDFAIFSGQGKGYTFTLYK